MVGGPLAQINSQTFFATSPSPVLCAHYFTQISKNCRCNLQFTRNNGSPRIVGKGTKFIAMDTRPSEGRGGPPDKVISISSVSVNIYIITLENIVLIIIVLV